MNVRIIGSKKTSSANVGCSEFSSMTTNPDIIIATPGRFLHLKVEMGLDLSSVRYIVFDEADRLFEMGFAAQLAEILHALPMSRQTLLFSATLPKSLVEFARAGLQEPRLIRLDDSKVSPDLESAFFTVKTGERDGALLHLLSKVIKLSPGETENARKAKKSEAAGAGKKRKRGPDAHNPRESPTPNSTVIFAATKHRVEYLASLLKATGYSVSYGKRFHNRVSRFSINVSQCTVIWTRLPANCKSRISGPA